MKIYCLFSNKNNDDKHKAILTNSIVEDNQ
jgi:hypothetical protein